MGELCLRHKLPFLQYLISGFGVVMKEDQLTNVSLKSEGYYIFPGAMPPSSLLCDYLGAIVLGIVYQQVHA